mgnify:CR=1 FL=1
MMTKDPGRDRKPDDPGLDRIVRAAIKHDFPVNVLFWGNVEAGTTLIDRHPDARFIIDHLAILQPRTPPAPPQPWADLPKVLDLAKRKNAVIKVSGACTLSQKPYPFPDIWDPLARLFDAWGGPKRWISIPGAGHNDLGAQREFWAPISQFLAERAR